MVSHTTTQQNGNDESALAIDRSLVQQRCLHKRVLPELTWIETGVSHEQMSKYKCKRCARCQHLQISGRFNKPDGQIPRSSPEKNRKKKQTFSRLK